MQHVVTLIGKSTNPRLTAEEVEALCHFAYRTHDHEVGKPAHAIFWYRTDGKELWKFWN